MKTAEAPQDCVEHAYFIVGYLILKSYKVISDVFSGIWKGGRYLMEVLRQSNHSSFLRHGSNWTQISIKAKTMKNVGKKSHAKCQHLAKCKVVPKKSLKAKISFYISHEVKWTHQVSLAGSCIHYLSVPALYVWAQNSLIGR